MPGHFSQILGDKAEEDFYALARAIGYGIIRCRNPVPGIDFVAKFGGKTVENCELLRPAHSPDGVTAFSVKSGDFSSSDVDGLLRYVDQCPQSDDPLLQQVKGAVLVTGAAKTLDQIRQLLSRGVFCWDIKRLIFYSVKAKTAARMSENGQVTELPLRFKGGFVFSLPRFESKSVMEAEVHVFLDDHDLVVQGDHLSSILDEVYTVGLEPIIQSTRCCIRMKMTLHAMGPIQREVVDQAYLDFYSGEKHNGLLPPAVRELEMQSYAVAPWTAIFRV
jgi:hypothetical protein